MKNIYTVGIISAGQIVTNMHLPVLCAETNLEVSWIHDADPSRAQRAGKNFSVPAPKGKLEDLAQTDIVLIAVPYGAREPIYQILRHRPNALYVEKPFARTVKQHEEYMRWFAHSQIAIGFQRRALGVVALLREIVSSCPFGRLTSVQVEHGHIGRLTGTGHGADFAMAGGGLLFDVAIHWIDLALVAVGATSAKVTTGCMIREGGFDLHTEGELAIRASRDNEIKMKILATGLEDTENRTLFQFENAGILFTHADLSVRLEKPGLQAMELNSRLQEYPVNALQLCHEAWQALVESIRSGQTNWTLAGTSVLTTSVIEQLYELNP